MIVLSTKQLEKKSKVRKRKRGKKVEKGIKKKKKTGEEDAYISDGMNKMEVLGSLRKGFLLGLKTFQHCICVSNKIK